MNFVSGMNPRFFTLIFLGIVAILPAGIFALAEWSARESAALDSPVPVWSGVTMLEGTGVSPKMVIDSGSNSQFAFNMPELEQWAGRPVINLADGVLRPFRYRVYRAARILREGDVIVFPLEWSNYPRDFSVSRDIIVDSFVGSDSRYYVGLPLRDRLKVVFGMLDYPSLWGILQSRHKAGDVELSAPELLQAYHLTYSGLRRGGQRRAGHEIGTERASPDVCDKYIFVAFQTNGWRLSPDFLADLDVLARLARERGVRVALAWPTVTGTACYQSAEVAARLGPYVAMIRREAEARGIVVIGEPHESAFGPEYFLNTNYHVNAAGQDHRTAVFLRQLASAGIGPFNDGDGAALDEEMRARAAGALRARDGGQRFVGLLAPPVWDGSRLGATDILGQALLPYGWGIDKQGHLAARSTAAEFRLRLAAPPASGARVCLVGSYPTGARQSVINLNDRRLLDGDASAVALPWPQAGDGKPAPEMVVQILQLAGKRGGERGTLRLEGLWLETPGELCPQSTAAVQPGDGPEAGQKRGDGKKKKKSRKKPRSG